ncbi:uncharacterized protein LOC115758057 [Drosophila novamexicana]|uniref:uncharacterized protein LOC115758057 n=1 Tax=Drosophila novamexicana TaxID=47314 RepID=UPI0011E5B935|nr:uncharacterized protein LOC115758057 [Drosophila novamexicana]
MEEVLRESKPSLLMIRYDYCPEVWLQRLLVEPQLAPVVLQSLSSTTPPSNDFSRLLHLICLPSVDYPAEQLAALLETVRGARSIFYISATASHASSYHVLHSLLRQCYKLKVLPVIALMAVDAGQFYYRYSPYPRFELEQLALDQRPFFVAHLSNMQRQPLILLPDQKHPRTIIYTDWRTGSQVLAGSVGRFMRTLAWKLNATIQFPMQIKPGVGLHYKELLTLVEQYQVDVPATVVQLMRPEQLPLISFPFELSHICLMIPRAQQLPIKEVYLILGSVYHLLIALAMVYSFGLLLSLHRCLTGQATSLVDFLLNDVALRGVLGQSFGHTLHTSIYVSFIFLMLAVLGLNVSSIHEAALGTLLTHPPKYFQPRRFADVQRAQLPLVVDGEDLENSYDLSELDLRLLLMNSSDFHSHRDKMNQSHVYFASRLKWTLLSEQQKYFPRDVFLYSMDACIRTLTHMVFQLPKSTWFLEPITRLIMDARDFGLFQHWVDMHFYDMAAAGLLSFTDPLQREPQRLEEALRLEDLQWIWIAYGALLLLATLVLALEILLERVQQRLGRS